MKNLFDTAVKEDLLRRIDQLKPNTKALWGKMNLNQTLWHMNRFIEIPLGLIKPTVAVHLPISKWLLKRIIINFKPPKGVASPFTELNVMLNHIDPTDFEAERNKLKQTIEKFTAAESLAAENKIAGTFSRDDWGRLCFNHTDHHLRQFGV